MLFFGGVSLVIYLLIPITKLLQYLGKYVIQNGLRI